MAGKADRAAWLKKGSAGAAAAVAIAAGLSLATASPIAGLIGAGLNAFAAIGMTAALGVGVALFNWRAFHCRDRLRRADAGHSLFGPLASAPKPQGAPALPG